MESITTNETMTTITTTPTTTITTTAVAAEANAIPTPLAQQETDGGETDEGNNDVLEEQPQPQQGEEATTATASSEVGHDDEEAPAAPAANSLDFPGVEGPTDSKDDVERPEDEFTTKQDLRRSKILRAKEDTRILCLPKGFTLQITPLLCCVVALILTYAGSWSCYYFEGASIGFTGGHYGIWTLEDSFGKCQLWDILFYSYHLDPFLSAARFLSMSAMVIGLANMTTMLQAQQIHLLSWGIGWGYGIVFVVSVSTSSIFNVWIVWWWFSYIIMTLLVRSLLVHPVVRRISKRGARIIASLFLYCAVSTLLTLIVLRSDYCRCVSLTTERLEREVAEKDEVCTVSCKLGASGYTTIFASFAWLATAAAMFKWGAQPKVLRDDPSKNQIRYAHYSRDSFATRMYHLPENVLHSAENVAGAVVHRVENVVEGVVHTATDVGNFIAHPSLSLHGAEKVEEGDAMAPKDLPHEVEQAEEFKEPDQTFCQKICCDYRVTERTRREKFQYWTFRTILGFIFFIYTFLTALLVGSRVENARAERSPSTDPNFITDVVCGFLLEDPESDFKTFPTKTEATLAGYAVAHCGACGQCSNIYDIDTYVRTRMTIAESSKQCGVKVYLGSYGDLVNCLEDRINFTRECTECWADNMQTTGRECFFTCVTSLFTGFLSNNNVPGAGDQGWLNHCLQCDERRSGTAFVTCSGVARRRLGIVSEIERNPLHQCRNTDVDWLEYIGVD